MLKYKQTQANTVKGATLKVSLPIKIFLLFFSVILSLSISSQVFALYRNEYISEEAKHVAGEILVKFKPQTLELRYDEEQRISSVFVTSPSIEELKHKYNIYKIEQIIKPPPPKEGKMTIMSIKEEQELPDIMKIYKLSFPTDVNVLDVVADFSKDPNVEFAEPNGICEIDAPNDPKYPFTGSVYYSQWGPQKIKLTPIGSPESGWNWSRGGEAIKICILDTGVDYNHPDLKDNIWVNSGEDINGDGHFDFRPVAQGGDINGIDDDGNGFIDDIAGWDFVSVSESSVAPDEDPGPRDNNPMDVHGHGTHCSGIASAVTDNSIGIAGVGWHCRIMAVRIGYKSPTGRGYMTWEDIVAGLYYATSMEADVISMSFGGSYGSEAMETAATYATSNGVVLIAAAGNTASTNPHYPAYYDNVLAVAATDINDYKASFSTYGWWVDVAAPGSNIYSTLPNNQYTAWSGTSMACPHVAGLAGLIKHRYSTYTNTQIKNTIKDTCDVISTSWEPGKRVNAFEALAPAFGCPIILRDTDSGSSTYTNSTIISVEAIPVLGEPDQIKVSLEASFAGVSWQPYQNPITFEVLPGDGVKTVYYKSIKDSVESPIEEANIILDQTSPEAISITLEDITSGSPIYTNERLVNVEISASDLYTVAEKMVSEDATFQGLSWEPYEENFQFELSPGIGTKEVYLRVIDIAGNISNIASTEIIYNPWALEMTGINVTDTTSGSDVYTNERIISVEAFNVVGSFEALTMFISEESTFSPSSGRPYENPASFEITSSGDGTKNIYYYIADIGRGYSTEVYSDTIILDTIKPSITVTEPPPTGINVSVNQRIRLTFNDEMITDSVSLEVYPELNLGDTNWSNGNKTLIFYPPDKLAFSTHYYITVEGQDKATNDLDTYSFDFTTEPICSIKGKITTDEVHGIPHISVEVYIDNEFWGIDTTDSLGNYFIENIASGNFVVEPIVPGYEIKTTSGTLTIDEDKENVDIVISREAWPQYHCDRYHRGFSPDTEIDDSLKLLWSYPTGATNDFEYRNSPVVAYGKVYIMMSNQKIYCLDAYNGSLKWSYDGEGIGMLAMTIANDKAYAFTRNGHIYCLDAEDGSLIWHKYYERASAWYAALWASPTYAGGSIYVTGNFSSKNRIYSLNAETGALNWSTLSRKTYGAVTVKEGIVYLADFYGGIYAYNSKTGEQIWGASPVEYGDYCRTTPVINGKNAFVAGGNNHHTYSINLESRTLNWSAYTSSAMVCATTVKDGTVYGSPNVAYSSLYALDETTGDIKWTRSLGGGARSSPAWAQGILFVGGGFKLYGIDADQNIIRWSYTNTSEINYSAPAIAYGMLFTADKNGNILAFRGNQAPNDPTNLSQYHFESGATLEAGGNTNLGRCILKFTLSDPDPSGTIYPEIEIRPTGEAFENIPNLIGEALAHTTFEVTAILTAEGLTNLTDYHWQARTRDDYDKTSSWVQFNSGNKAFGVNDITSPEVISTSPTSGETHVSTFSNITITFSEPMDDESIESAFQMYPEASGTWSSYINFSTYEVFVFEPLNQLADAEIHLVTIEGSARDEAGNPMSHPYTFSFETIHAGEISGHVYLEGSGGISGALVEISTSEITKTSDVTDSSGYYHIPDLPQGKYTAQAFLPGRSIKTYYDVPITAEVMTTQNFTLKPAWPMFLGDKSNSKENPNADLNPPLKLKWSYSTGDSPDSKTGVAIENGRVFIATEGGILYALDIDDGEKLWSYDVNYDYVYTAPSVMNGIVYMAGDKFYALNESNGNLIWSQNIFCGTIGSVINNGHLYIGGGNKLYCFDLQNKSLKWSYPAGISIGYAAPCVYNSMVYFTAGTTLKAVNLENRTLEWAYNIGGTANDEASPCVSDGIVYACSTDGTLYAFDYLGGDLLWTYSQSGEILNSPLVTEDRVYFGGSNVFYAIDKSSHTLVWSKDVGQDLVSSPIMVNGTIYIGGSYGGTNDSVLAIDPDDGEILWSYTTGGGIWATLGAAEGTLIVGCEDGYVRAFESALSETTSPTIDALVDGGYILNGDMINPMPEIIATITDNTTVDVSSIELQIDGTIIEDTTISTIEENTSYRLTYKITSPLEPENIKTHSFMISAKDAQENLTVWERTGLKVIPGDVAVVGQSLTYPSVFKALEQEKVIFAYNLSQNAPISFYLYDISGQLILTKRFKAGEPGGRTGYNSFNWNGITDFGGIVGNGIYIYKITSRNKIIGTGKLVVYD